MVSRMFYQLHSLGHVPLSQHTTSHNISQTGSFQNMFKAWKNQQHRDNNIRKGHKRVRNDIINPNYTFFIFSSIYNSHTSCQSPSQHRLLPLSKIVLPTDSYTLELSFDTQVTADIETVKSGSVTTACCDVSEVTGQMVQK